MGASVIHFGETVPYIRFRFGLPMSELVLRPNVVAGRDGGAPMRGRWALYGFGAGWERWGS